MRILFFLKREKPLRDGSVPIYIRITVHNTTFECSAHKSIHPDQWITLKGRVRGSTLNNKQLNAYLDQQEFLLNEIERELKEENHRFTAKDIIRRFKGEDVADTSFIAVYEKHNIRMADLIGSTVAMNTHKRHETSLKLFREFLQFEYNRFDISVIRRALPDLFHYLDNPEIPKSTNALESFFGHLKTNLRQHRGLPKEHFKSYVKWYLFFKNNRDKYKK